MCVVLISALSISELFLFQLFSRIIESYFVVVCCFHLLYGFYKFRIIVDRSNCCYGVMKNNKLNCF